MDHKNLLLRQFKFYKEIKSKVEIFLGRASPRLERYKRAYLAEIQKAKPTKSTEKLFFKSLQGSDILLFGDFHSEPQSIRSLLRICRKLKANEFVLALECIDFKHQQSLEKYMTGDISENDFIIQAQWNKNWEFPFKFVKPLFHWASQHKVAVYALNKADQNLLIRDRKIAQNIKIIKQLHPNKLLIVQIGDYHLAQKHLVLEIKKILPTLKLQTVFQSPDELYFQWVKHKKNIPDFLSLGRHKWAVMAVLPWVKWQNYLLWLESSGAKIQFDDDHEVDMTDHIARYVNFLAETMKIPTATSELSIYVTSDVDVASEFKNLDMKLKSKIKNDILNQKSFYVPEIQKGYVDSFSLNHIGKLAAEYFLYKNQIYTKTITDPKTFFISLIWLEMLTYFFTKTVNPKRKTNTVFDMRSFLMSEKFEDHGKDVLSIALEQKLKEMNSQNVPLQSRKRSQNRSHSKASYASAARLLGGIMGEKVFWAYSNKRLSFPEGKKFLFQDVYNKSFLTKYYDLIEVIDHWPTTTKSKFDQF